MGENAPKLFPDELIESLILDPEDQLDAEPEEGKPDGADDIAGEPDAPDPGPPPPADLPVEGVVAVDSGDAPIGWRVDKFGSRSVAVPPWSRRPPDVYPEAWVMASRGEQRLMIEDWKKKDPEGYGLQAARREGHLANVAKKRKLGVCSLL